MPVNRLGPIYDPNMNHGSPNFPFIYIGFVKRNDDAQKMGRLSIWIPEFGGSPNDESAWIICSYCSPFAGCNDITKVPNYTTNTQIAQQSYGLWMVPPDINNEVAVFFAGGKMNRGYWFACCYQQSMNHMVPGIAVNVTTEPQPPVHISPVTEYNKSDKTLNVDSPRRPPFAPLTGGLIAEGLTTDEERGSSSTSARRETPSFVYGLLSPRGNTIHIDDNHSGDSATGTSVNEFIRIRTRSGTQVLVDETTGMVYINSKLGNAWLEVSDAGVDVYSMNSVSIRAKLDFNVRADRNILMDAGANIAMRAGGNITMEAVGEMDVHVKGNINVASDSNINALAHTDFIVATGSDFQVGAGGNLVLTSVGSTNLKAGGNQNRDGAAIFDNAGKASTAMSATNPIVPTPATALDTTQTRTAWQYGGGTVSTIVSRMPTHEPWRGHPSSAVPPPPLDDSMPASGTQTAGNPNAAATDGCSFNAANTKPISSTNFNAISAASNQVGVPLSTMLAFSDIESGNNASAGAGSSSAQGLYQFTSGTWNGMVQQYGNAYNVSQGQILDPSANALMGAQFLKNNTTILQNNGITNPTPGQLYAMHFMGSSGGPALINAAANNPNADASLMFPAAAAANPSIFNGKTVGQVYTNISSLADAKATAYANQQGLPPPCQRAGATPTNPNGTAASGGTAGTQPAPTAGSALAAAESNLGQTHAQAAAFMAANGVTIGANQNWCAAYTNASLQAAGIQGDSSNVATSFLNWGNPVTGAPQAGDVIVQSNGYAAGVPGGHVGIATGVVNSQGQYQMVSGNYANQVSYSYVSPSAVSVRRAGT